MSDIRTKDHEVQEELDTLPVARVDCRTLVPVLVFMFMLMLLKEGLKDHPAFEIRGPCVRR